MLHPNSVIDDRDVTNVWATTKFSLDEGSIVSRVSFAFGESGKISILAGVQYTRLKQELEILYQQRSSAEFERHVAFTRENTLSGVGPSVSVGTRWDMGGVNLFGEIGAAMLVSTIGAKSSSTILTTALLRGRCVSKLTVITVLALCRQ